MASCIGDKVFALHFLHLLLVLRKSFATATIHQNGSNRTTENSVILRPSSEIPLAALALSFAVPLAFSFLFGASGFGRLFPLACSNHGE
jgi:hypothetical protein